MMKTKKKWSHINDYLDILCHICIQKVTPRLLRHTDELEKVHELVVVEGRGMHEFLIA